MKDCHRPTLSDSNRICLHDQVKSKQQEKGYLSQNAQNVECHSDDNNGVDEDIFVKCSNETKKLNGVINKNVQSIVNSNDDCGEDETVGR